MSKARIEEILDHLVRYNGNIYTRKEFILIKLLSGGKPDKVYEEHRYNNRTGDYCKPKYEYRLNNNDKSFHDITKTEYEFAHYLLSNHLFSEDAVLQYVAEENGRLALRKQMRKAMEELKQDSILAQNEAKEDFKSWLREQALSYSNQIWKDLMRSIFLDVLGTFTPRYDLLVFIENIDMPRCRQQLIERLHIHNKASRKTFEYVTGLKLPNKDRDTHVYLKSLSAANYKEPLVFTSRKRRFADQEESFFVLTATKNIYEEVLGIPYSEYGLDLFYYCILERHYICDTRTGVRLGSGDTKEDASMDLKKMVERMTMEKVIARLRETEEEYGVSPRCRLQDAI